MALMNREATFIQLKATGFSGSIALASYHVCLFIIIIILCC